MEKNNQPVQVFKLGRIRAAIWANETREGDVWWNVKFSRLYKENDEWKDSDSYSRDDLPAVAKAADMAYSWIWRRQMERDKASANSSATR